MIQCPECSKDIADDSAHCGFCGAKIETGAGKKTMMGFAALTGDRLKEAAEEARRARLDAEAAASQAAPSAPSTPSAPPDPSKPATPSLPKRPSQTRPLGDDRPKLPQIPRPTPQAGTPMSESLQKLSVGDDQTTDDNAPTAVMAAVPGDAPSTVDEEAITDGPDFAADTNPNPPPSAAPKTVPVAPPTEDTLPELDAADRDGPSEFGSSPTVDGPSEFGTGSNVIIPENTLPEKKKNPVVFIVGGIAILFFMCCAFWIAYSFLLPFLLA